ncbi:MAG TPA: hypothetical protein PK720_01300 [bacterium]|nr:hypothetical protein [bacterium]
MPNQQGNQKKTWFNKPKFKEIVLEVEKRLLETKSSGYVIGVDAKVYYKESGEPYKNVNVNAREKDIYLLHSSTNSSGFTYLPLTFDLSYANSTIQVDIFVEDYSVKKTIEISFPEPPKTPEPPSKDPEHLTLETGYSNTKKQYYLIARLLQAKGVALSQDLVITIDGNLITLKTDLNGFLMYLIPHNFAPQSPGDQIKITVSASGIKETAYSYLRWDCPIKENPYKKYFTKMLIAMPILWVIALTLGFSNPFSRLFFGSVLIYSTVIVPLFLLLFSFSYRSHVYRIGREIGRNTAERFSTVAGDSLAEKIGTFMSESKKSGTKPSISNIFSTSSGKGFKGWAMDAFKNIRSFVIDAAMFEGIEHVIKRIFR